MIDKDNAIKLVNEYLDSLKIESIEVKIPHYSQRWKVSILETITFFLSKIEKLRGKTIWYEDGISNRDYSRVIFPDKWITSSTKYRVSIVQDYGSLYKFIYVNEFTLDNLKYGMRPILAYEYIIRRIGGTLLMDKKTSKIYHFNSYLEDFVDDYNSYRENKKTLINWKKYEIPDSPNM